MALLIYMKGEGAQAMIARGTMEKFETAIKSGGKDSWYIVCEGWHGKKLLITFDCLSHIVEETDAQMKKNMAENKKQAEARARAQGQGIIKTPGLLIPGRGNN